MTVLFPGSFDPVTMGHVSVIRRASAFADRLLVAVLDNPDKTPLFSAEERVQLLQEALCHTNAEIEAFSGLLADYARQKGANAILRGLRTPGDFEREYRYAAYNGRLSGIETIFLPAAPEFVHVSSSIIKEAARLDPTRLAAFAELLPPASLAALQKTFS